VNMNNQLDNTSLQFSYSPVPIRTGVDWKSVTAGFSHCLALKNDGSIWSWGSNGSNECEREPPETLNLLLGQIGEDTDWQSISAGRFSSLALKKDGTLWNWGHNTLRWAEWDNRTVFNTINAKPVNSDHDWNWIPRTYHDTCFAIKEDGTLWGWGMNGFGQLGDGTRIDKDYLVRILPLAE